MVAEASINRLAEADANLAGDVLNQLIDAASNGEEPQLDYAEIADTMGVSASEARIMVMGSAMEMSRTADEALHAAGITDTEEFVDWVLENHRATFNEAIRNHVYGAGTEGYAQLARLYLNNEDGAARAADEDLLDADFGDSGVTAARAADGRVVFNIPGHGSVEARTALRAGLVKISG